METRFDAIVIGGGHAGVEASRALAVRGFKTALISFDSQKIGAMSCNPAIGGVGKSHLVYEVDALGGLMGVAADHAAIQSRRLNLRKGPAVRSTRVQCDKAHYTQLMSKWVSTLEHLYIYEGEAAGFTWDESSRKVTGVRMKDGSLLQTRAVVITSGTFMRGLMFCGDERSVGGRVGESAAQFLSDSLERIGHKLSRLKTGTPARLRSSSIRFEGLARQWGDPEKRQFSWRPAEYRLPQLSCFITHTNERTHEVIRANFGSSPLFSGDIVGVGPRYCPSVEDKIRRFPDRERHQIFLEPEGLNTESIYPNGMSTSLPAAVQLEFLRTISGLESVELLRPGYAVEYDTVDPTDLTVGFMSKRLDGLFLAGQVNRTSGYEEAAAQGLWAGINASLWLEGRDFVEPDRSRSYLETLVDDLTSVGTEEPYRMFTSRSEYRLMLREDNAHERLYTLGDSLGLLSDEQKRWNDSLRLGLDSAIEALGSQRIRLDKDRVISLFEYLKRPEVAWEDLALELDHRWDDRVLEKVEVKAKYDGYLHKQEQEIEQLRRVRGWALDPTVSLRGVPGLTTEAIEKFEACRPKNVYELGRISGMTPAALLTIVRLAGRGPEDVSRETL
jgi:tRNA uridine 5-carboxymethylaminomethyl modification enzyme